MFDVISLPCRVHGALSPPRVSYHAYAPAYMRAYRWRNIHILRIIAEKEDSSRPNDSFVTTSLGLAACGRFETAWQIPASKVLGALL